MSSNAIPQPLRDLLVKLEFIAMIQRGKKPCMNDMSFVDASSWLGSFKRFYNREDRRSMLVQIDQIIDQAIMTITEYKDTEFISILIETLARARVGINNLMTTYQRSPHIVARLQVTLSNIILQLGKNKQYLQGKT